MNISKISFVIPVYNEQMRILKTLEELIIFFNKFEYEYEIIFVNDGSTDDTSEIISKYIKEKSLNNYKLLNFTINRGKGAAVKFGMLNTSPNSNLFFFMDADLSTPLQEINNFINYYQETETDIIIGSRSLTDSRVLKRQQFYREWMGKTFNKLVKLIIFTKFVDTQCGFKLFTKKSKEKIFNLLRIARFSFDVEIVYLAKIFEFSIIDKPVIWINDERSRVNIFSDSIQMLIDIFKIRWYRITGKYLC